jgi:hypothetical protein
MSISPDSIKHLAYYEASIVQPGDDLPRPPNYMFVAPDDSIPFREPIWKVVFQSPIGEFYPVAVENVDYDVAMEIVQRWNAFPTLLETFTAEEWEERRRANAAAKGEEYRPD